MQKTSKKLPADIMPSGVFTITSGQAVPKVAPIKDLINKYHIISNCSLNPTLEEAWAIVENKFSDAIQRFAEVDFTPTAQWLQTLDKSSQDSLSAKIAHIRAHYSIRELLNKGLYGPLDCGRGTKTIHSILNNRMGVQYPYFLSETAGIATAYEQNWYDHNGHFSNCTIRLGVQTKDFKQLGNYVVDSRSCFRPRSARSYDRSLLAMSGQCFVGTIWLPEKSCHGVDQDNRQWIRSNGMCLSARFFGGISTAPIVSFSNGVYKVDTDNPPCQHMFITNMYAAPYLPTILQIRMNHLWVTIAKSLGFDQLQLRTWVDYRTHNVPHVYYNNDQVIGTIEHATN